MWNSNTFGSRAYNGHIHGCLQNKTTRNKIRNSQLVFSSCHSFSRLARKIDWHLPFAVYMIPVIPLILTPFLKHRTSESKRIITNAIKNSENINGNSANPLNKKLQKNLLWEQIIVYFLLTFSAITITYYLPFLMQDNKMGTTQVGIATSVFFLFITIPGFSLTFLVKILGRSIKPISISMIIIGLSLIAAFNNLYIFIIASALTGMGYGIMQPLIYDATSLLATKRTCKHYICHISLPPTILQWRQHHSS